MRDILPELDRWRAEGKQLALATVVQTWGSAPRQAGSKMVVTSDGQFSGSVSGGCVENAVIEAALDVIKTGQARLLHFGVADEAAWEVGLACGGSIEIFVQPFNSAFFPSLRSAWLEASPSVHGTLIRGAREMLGREFVIQADGVMHGNPWDSEKVAELARTVFLQGKSQRVLLDEETEIFLELISPAPTLIVVGAVHIAMALMSLANVLGFRTVVIDPRSVWGNEQRFPKIDQLVQAWPQEAFQQVTVTRSTAIVMLTHDPKLDDPALKIALNSPAFYVGALGSKKTNAQRRERLLKDGMPEEQLSRLRAPVGLDIAAQTPEEIALAILAEIVEVYRRQTQETAASQTKAQPVGATSHGQG